MLDLIPAHRPILANRHHIEPVEIVRTPVPKPPDFREPPEDDPLPVSDRLHGRAADDGTPRLYLHEGHQGILPGYQIEIVTAPAKAVRFDVPPARGEIRQRHALTDQPANLARIIPRRAWHESSGVAHDRD